MKNREITCTNTSFNYTLLKIVILSWMRCCIQVQQNFSEIWNKMLKKWHTFSFQRICFTSSSECTKSIVFAQGYKLMVSTNLRSIHIFSPTKKSCSISSWQCGMDRREIADFLSCRKNDGRLWVGWLENVIFIHALSVCARTKTAVASSRCLVCLLTNCL